ncbi:hypothetical protein DOY81_009590, partial [Sarcophaga bullata]
ASKFPVVERIADDIKQYLGITPADSLETTKKETTLTSLESKEVDESKPKSSNAAAAAAAQKSKRGRRKH